MEGAASRMAASSKNVSLLWTCGGIAKVAKMCFSSEGDAPTDTDFWLSIGRGTSSQGPLEFSPQDILDYWMVSLERNQRQMLAVIMTEHFKHTLNLSVKQAVTETGLVVAFNEKLCADTETTFSRKKDTLYIVQQQGKYERHCVQHDKVLNHKAAKWVREHAFVKESQI